MSPADRIYTTGAGGHAAVGHAGLGAMMGWAGTGRDEGLP